jgi:hypothetical protein
MKWNGAHVGAGFTPAFKFFKKFLFEFGRGRKARAYVHSVPFVAGGHRSPLQREVILQIDFFGIARKSAISGLNRSRGEERRNELNVSAQLRLFLYIDDLETFSRRGVEQTSIGACKDQQITSDLFQARSGRELNGIE